MVRGGGWGDAAGQGYKLSIIRPVSSGDPIHRLVIRINPVIYIGKLVTE